MTDTGGTFFDDAVSIDDELAALGVRSAKAMPKVNGAAHAPPVVAPPPVDPAVAPLLAKLARTGSADDTRPETDVIAELDVVVNDLRTTVGGWRAEKQAARTAEEQIAEIDRLRLLALDPVYGPDILPKLAEVIERRKKTLGITDELRVPSLSERLLARLTAPPLVHVPTSLPTLDAATRGGLLMRRVHVIGGEPDAGKTALLVQMLLEAARQGYAVGIYAVDEPGEGIEDRIGQSLGLALEDLEANVQAAIIWLATEVRSLPHVLLFEQGEDGIACIEDAADRLIAHAKRHGCKGAVLGVDSLQTAACRAHLGPDAPRFDRDRIEAMTTALRATAKRGAGVYVTSELGRASYAVRPGKDGAKPSPMAAFKGSGSIEYTMTVGIILSRITKGDHAGDIRVVVPKNKRGDPAYRSVAIRLERDPDRCTYTDRGRIDFDEGPSEGQEGAPKSPSGATIETACSRVRRALAGMPQGFRGGRAELAILAGGRNATTRAAIAQMLTRGELLDEHPEGEPRRLRLRGAADPHPGGLATPDANDP